MTRWVIVLAATTGCEAPLEPGPSAVEPSHARVLGPGCAGSAYPTIQAALNAAVNGDIVEVCAGTWRERLEVSGKALTLRSGSGAASTILDGTGGTTLKVRNGANLVVQGFTIRNGSSSGTGGNVSCSSSTLELRDNVVESGSAKKGGGVGSSSCTALLTGNTFRLNHADDKGGAVYASPGVDLTNNRFEDNESYEGGACYVKDSDHLVAGNRFLHNVADDDGGGFMVYRGAPTIEDNLFEDNYSDEEGGGLRVKSASASIRNNTFRRNEASWRGGGAKISHDEVTMSGNLWEDNHSGGKAGALLLFESASLLQYETFRNNESDHGGAIAILEGWGSVTIEDSRFEGNRADERGGHIFVDLLDYRAKLRRVDLVGGMAEMGGALYATSESDLDDYDPYDPDWVGSYTSVQLENTLFEDNVATISGGALFFDAVEGWVRNGLVLGNDAPAGAGIQVVNGRSAFAVTNTILRSNTTGPTIQRDTGTSPTVTYSDFNGNTTDFGLGMTNVVGVSGNRSSSPQFVDEAGGDYHLDPSSSLVNRGDPALLDPNGTRSDIGLYGGPNSAP